MRNTLFILLVLGVNICFSQDKAIPETNIKAYNQFLFVDYQPFFPIGLYSFPNKRNDDEIWKEASEAGFNFVMTNESGRYGMKVSRPIPKVSISDIKVSLMEVHRGEKLQNQFRDFLNRHETDSTMICWHAPDEPSWHGPSAEVLINGYEFIRSHSKKPVWLNMGPSFLSRENYSKNSTFLETCDIISEDIYPVPDGKRKKGQGNNIDMKLVGEHTSGIKALVSKSGAQQKPVWMVLQSFGWSSLNEYFNNPDDYFPPTKDELRFMVFDAIVNGATGIIFYGLEFESLQTEKGADLWASCKNIANELRELNPVLTSLTQFNNDYLLVQNEKSEEKETPIQHLIKVVGGDVYVIAVNTSSKAQKEIKFTAFPDIGGSVTKAIDCTTNKELKVLNERFWYDSLEGFGVRIYKTDLRYDFYKREKKH